MQAGGRFGGLAKVLFFVVEGVLPAKGIRRPAIGCRTALPFGQGAGSGAGGGGGACIAVGRGPALAKGAEVCVEGGRTTGAITPPSRCRRSRCLGFRRQGSGDRTDCISEIFFALGVRLRFRSVTAMANVMAAVSAVSRTKRRIEKEKSLPDVISVFRAGVWFGAEYEKSAGLLNFDIICGTLVGRPASPADFLPWLFYFVF